MPDSAFAIAFVTLTFLLAGMVKGVIGMGLPTLAMGLMALAMGLLALVMAPLQAAALLVIPSLVTYVWQLAAGPAFGSVARRFAVMMLCVVLGTFAGIGLLTGSAGPAASAVLAVYGVVGLASPRRVVASRAEKWLSPPAGLITGLLTGAPACS